MTSITSQQKRELKTQVHSLKPVVTLGNNGLTPTVLQEINLALDIHELIKIRINETDRETRDALISKICKSIKAELIQAIGYIAAIYRKNPNK